jgi:hypothetical protein
MFENLLNVYACTRGLFFAYLNAHARAVIKGAFHHIGRLQMMM